MRRKLVGAVLSLALTVVVAGGVAAVKYTTRSPQVIDTVTVKEAP